MKFKLAFAVALASIVNINIANAASKEEIIVCDAKHELAFDIMNGRQNLVKKEVFLNDPSTTPDAAAIIYRAYAKPEVPVHEIAYEVRDFAKEERDRCMKKLAI